MIRSTSLSGCNLRPCPSCSGCPPDLRPVGSCAGRGLALGGSDDGGWEEFRDVCLSRASTSTSRLSNSCTNPRTAGGVAAQSSRLIPVGGACSGIAGVLPITKPHARQSHVPRCAVTFFLLLFYRLLNDLLGLPPNTGVMRQSHPEHDCRHFAVQ